MALKSGPNPRRTTFIGGGAMHNWRFTWQTFPLPKRHVRRQFEVVSMPAEGGHFEGEEIEGGHFGEVRRLKGVILEGEENEMGYTRWPPIGAEGPQLAKRACPPRRGRENEGA